GGAGDDSGGRVMDDSRFLAGASVFLRPADAGRSIRIDGRNRLRAAQAGQPRVRRAAPLSLERRAYRAVMSIKQILLFFEPVALVRVSRPSLTVTSPSPVTQCALAVGVP